MKVLVTGSEGFLGKHICAALRERGHEVIGLDVLPGADVVAEITEDIIPRPGMQVDAVIHLAAVASPSVCEKNPELAFQVNVFGTHQVLRMAMELGAKKFVFSSSAHVYGIPPRYLPTGEDEPLSGKGVYTTTKILGEQLCQVFYQNHGLRYTTLRLFNAYGQGQALGYFIPDQIEKAKRGIIELKGGNTTKDFVYVTDAADAFVKAVETQFVGPVNVGTGVETSLARVTGIIAVHFGKTWIGVRGDDVTRMRCDWSRAERVLGWKPTVNLEEGLRATLSGHTKSNPVPA